jgi:hypothetical protein
MAMREPIVAPEKTGGYGFSLIAQPALFRVGFPRSARLRAGWNEGGRGN